MPCQYVIVCFVWKYDLFDCDELTIFFYLYKSTPFPQATSTYNGIIHTFSIHDPAHYIEHYSSIR